MMKLCRKLVAFVLSLAIVFTLPLSAGALDKNEVGTFFHKGFYNTAETLVEGLLRGIASLIPAPRSWKSPDDAARSKHMRGTEPWLQTPAENAGFSLGYNESSLLDTLPVSVHSLFVGGSIAFSDKLATALLDDLRVRNAALSDGSGRGMTEILLDVMKKYGAHGTFDVVGFTGDNYPDEAGKVGTPLWGGTRFDHYPDFGRDTCGGALHQMELVKRMLREGHSLSNHGYRHIIFGKKPFVYGKRSSLGDIDKVLADQKALHDLILKETGCTVTMGRPPHYVDRIDKNLTSYDAYALMDYQYMAASYDGGGWLPSGESDEKKATQAEIDAMISVIRKKLDADPDFFRGQIIFQKDGCNMAKRTPVAAA